MMKKRLDGFDMERSDVSDIEAAPPSSSFLLGIKKKGLTVDKTKLATASVTFVVGWYLPKVFLGLDDSFLLRQPPFQTLQSGEVVLDLALNKELVDPPTIPCTYPYPHSLILFLAAGLLIFTGVWAPLIATASLEILVDNTVGAATAGFLTTVGVSEWFTQIFKQFVARRRPNFYQLCGFANNVCSASAKRIKESQLSFPSGHSSLSCCSTAFVAWYVSHLLLRYRKPQLAFWLTMLLMGWPIYVGCTRLADSWHHPSDVVAGLLLGGFVASVSFNTLVRPYQKKSS